MKDIFANETGPSGEVTPSDVKEIRAECEKRVQKLEVSGQTAKADLLRIRTAIGLWSLAKQNEGRKYREEFSRYAYKWTVSELLDLDIQRWQRRLSQSDSGAPVGETSQDSTQSKEEPSPAEQSAQEVLDRMRSPNRSLKELKGERLQSELTDVIERLIVALKLRNHPAYDNRALGAVLFTGPPGTGKTTAAEGVAHEIRNRGHEFNFLPIKGHHFKNHLYGSSQETVERIFEHANEMGPTIIFIDEFEDVATRGGDRHEATQGITNTLLSLLSGGDAMRDTVLIGATNRPGKLDPAIKSRVGDSIVEFTEPPDEIKPDILLDSLKGPGVDTRFSRGEITASELNYAGLVGRDLEIIARIAIQTAAVSNGGTIDSPFRVNVAHIEEAIQKRRNQKQGSLAGQ